MSGCRWRRKLGKMGRGRRGRWWGLGGSVEIVERGMRLGFSYEEER